MKKIELFFVSGGCPAVEVDGEYLEMKGVCLSVIKQRITKVTQEMGFGNIKGVSAWGGAIMRNAVRPHPAETLDDIVFFSDIIVHEADEYTRAEDFLKKIRPALSLLVWQKNKHFIEIGSTGVFECVVCGKTQYGRNVTTNEAVPCIETKRFFPPHHCALDTCYSHNIWDILNPGYKEERELRGVEL